MRIADFKNNSRVHSLRRLKKFKYFIKKITIYYEATGDDSLGGTCFGVDIY